MIWLFADVGPTPDPLGMTSSTGSVTQSLALDLSQGPINDLCTQTTSLALRLFVVFGLIALIVEAFGHGLSRLRLVEEGVDDDEVVLLQRHQLAAD